MKSLLICLSLFALFACKKKEDSPKKASGMNEAKNSGGQTPAGGEASSGDSNRGNEIEEPIKITRNYLMNKDNFAYCQTTVSDEPRYIFPDLSPNIVEGECPATNDLNAGVLKTCPSKYDATEKSTTTVVVYKEMKLENGGTKTLNEADANDFCDLFAKDVDELGP